jgi:hypothetical protein
MRRLAIASMLAAVALATAPAAHAADVGANDDTGKFAPDGGAAFYERMAAMGPARRSSPSAGGRASPT